jgi:hypothetical protein
MALNLEDHPEPRGAIVVGDGSFRMNAIGASRCQSQIEHLVGQSQIEHLIGGRTQMGYGVVPGYNRALFAALLLPETDDPYESHAVRVIIRNVSVGYLEREAAKDFVAALARDDLDRAACMAAVCGGGHRRLHDRDDDGLFGVRLDAVIPFRFRAPRI